MLLLLLLVAELLAVLIAVAGVWMFSPAASCIVLGVTLVIIIERFSAATGGKQ